MDQNLNMEMMTTKQQSKLFQYCNILHFHHANLRMVL